MKKLHFTRLIFLCLAASLRAQQPAGPPSLPVAQPQQTATDSSTPTLKVQSKLTIEDVTVTDAKDKPVHGLTQGDFTVKEDGKPQAIKNFEEYGSEQPQAQAPPPKLPPDTYSNRQMQTPSAVNILLLDNVATGPVNLAIERLQAIKYLKAMPEGTEVAIMKMEFIDGLSMVQGFTSDRNVLLAAVDSVKPEPPLILGCETPNKMSEITTASLAGIAEFVSGIKGRKNLIWFTPGIPWLTNYELFSRATCLRDYTSQLHNDYGLLRAARVAVYPINPKGLQGGCGVTNAGGAVPCTEKSVMLEHDSMLDFANNTGGKAYYDRNDLDGAIGEAIANGSDYYSLSYVPPLSKYDGKYHTIDVKVDRPGLNLLYREGYTALDATQPEKVKETDKKSSGKPAAQPASQFHAAMDHGPAASDLTFDVRVQPSAAASEAGGAPVQKMQESLNPKLKGQPLTPYTFQYLIPAGEITFAGGNVSGTQTASAELAVAVFSTDGEQLNAAGQTTVYSVPQNQAAQLMNQPSRVTVQLDPPPGKLLVRVGVLDVASQKMGILEIPQTVTKE